MAKRHPISFRELDTRSSHWLRGFRKRFVSDLRATYRLGRRNGRDMMVSSLTFSCIFAFFPMLILGFTAARLAISPQSGSDRELASFLESVVPDISPMLHQELLGLLTHNPLGDGLGILLLVWALRQLFRTLEQVFTQISLRGEHRDVIGAHVLSFLCFGLIVVCSSVSMALLTMKSTFLATYLGDLSPRQFMAVRAALVATSILCVAMSITVVFKIMPTQPIRFLNAFQGALLFLALFLAGRYGYGFYLRFSQATTNHMYGGFATMILLFVWMYYLSWIFVFSAQYVVHLEESRRRRAV